MSEERKFAHFIYADAQTWPVGEKPPKGHIAIGIAGADGEEMWFDFEINHAKAALTWLEEVVRVGETFGHGEGELRPHRDVTRCTSPT